MIRYLLPATTQIVYSGLTGSSLSFVVKPLQLTSSPILVAGCVALRFFNVDVVYFVGRVVLPPGKLASP